MDLNYSNKLRYRFSPVAFLQDCNCRRFGGKSVYLELLHEQRLRHFGDRRRYGIHSELLRRKRCADSVRHGDARMQLHRLDDRDDNRDGHSHRCQLAGHREIRIRRESRTQRPGWIHQHIRARKYEWSRQQGELGSKAEHVDKPSGAIDLRHREPDCERQRRLPDLTESWKLSPQVKLQLRESWHDAGTRAAGICSWTCEGIPP